jgi:hypothetical protein
MSVTIAPSAPSSRSRTGMLTESSARIRSSDGYVIFQSGSYQYLRTVMPTTSCARRIGAKALAIDDIRSGLISIHLITYALMDPSSS